MDSPSSQVPKPSMSATNSVPTLSSIDINANSLTAVQKSADTFFRAAIPNIAKADQVQLFEGIQDGKDFKFNYVNKNAPVTITSAYAKQTTEGDNPQFQLVQALQTLSGPVTGGTMTTTSQGYGVTDLKEAAAKLGWDQA